MTASWCASSGGSSFAPYRVSRKADFDGSDSIQVNIALRIRNHDPLLIEHFIDPVSQVDFDLAPLLGIRAYRPQIMRKG